MAMMCKHPVDAPVAGPREPVALLLAGGGVDGRGAVPGGEMAAVSETGDVAEQPGSAGRSDAMEVLQAAAGGSDPLGQLRVGGLDLLGRWRRAR
jgi:hypothetical protein